MQEDFAENGAVQGEPVVIWHCVWYPVGILGAAGSGIQRKAAGSCCSGPCCGGYYTTYYTIFMGIGVELWKYKCSLGKTEKETDIKVT